jgi:hypothetical protein
LTFVGRVGWAPPYTKFSTEVMDARRHPSTPCTCCDN